MKKILFFSALLLCGLALFAQTPKYTTERMSDGNLAYTCASENDALLLLNGNYNLPDNFWVVVLLKGLYLEDSPLNNLGKFFGYQLCGTKLTNAQEHGYKTGLGGLCQTYHNLNKNTEYYVLWKVEKNAFGGRTSMVRVIADKNWQPLPEVKRN